MFSTASNAPAAKGNASDPTGGCFHCGEPCAENAFVLEGKPFCCLGCQTVFSLLRENGLGQFYQLQAAPGTRIRSAAAVAKWAFLDDPLVQERLFDYADSSRAKVTLRLPAIHCVACVWLLENLFKLHPGIGHSQVNFSRREAAITFAPDKIKLSELAALLASIGYEPELTLASGNPVETSGEQSPTSETRRQSLSRRTWLQIGVAAFAFGNIMLMSLPFYFGLDSFNGPWFRALAGWLSLVLALPVVIYSAADFWRAAWLSLRQRQLTLEVPIAFGLAAIYVSSIVEVVSHRGPGYCDSLAGLIFFLLGGRLFQKKTYDRLGFDRDYQGFFPLSVLRKTAAGEESVAISRLQVGDRLVLRNGELLPADARLLSGAACMDYSFVTGESVPVTSAAGAHLYAGGRQTGGAIEVETLKPVAQSYLASLWSHEAFRKNREDDLDSLTNRYSRYFTRLVIGVAVAVAVFWMFRDAGRALKIFTSILIVACPCALALAAPLTHGTAQRILARRKIFLKNALVIERMAGVDAIVFDKTGTLTTADAQNVKFISSAGKQACRAGLTADESQWIASLARHSTHPNSVRVAEALDGVALPVMNFQEIPGAGIEGEISGHTLRMGSPTWLNAGMNEENAPARGSSVGVMIDGEMRGVLVLENSLRSEISQLVAQLGSSFELALLSGDNERDAAKFREIFGDHAKLLFNQKPADKLEFIRQLQARGRKVMMVGDGLNDAGALKQADVGVAVVENIGAFSPASDVILDAAELPRLAQVLAFSRHAARVVRAGFAVSAVYNLVGVSVAAAGLLSPIICAILMPLSSVTVTAFVCGLTVWLGRRLTKTSNVFVAPMTERQSSPLQPQLLTKEAV